MSMVLIPRVSEKAMALAEQGVYVFNVPTSANKIEVAKAIEKAFNVSVIDVNVLIHKGKPVSKRYGKHAGTRNDIKKAMVTVKKGQKIALFEESK